MEKINEESNSVLNVQELRARFAEVKNAICDLYKETNSELLKDDCDIDRIRSISAIQCACLRMLHHSYE